MFKQVAPEVCELLNKAIDQCDSPFVHIRLRVTNSCRRRYQNAGARRAMFFLLACVAREQLELKMCVHSFMS